MKPIHLEIASASAPLSKTVRDRRELEGGGHTITYRTVPDGVVTGELVIDIDLRSIVETMGTKALRNRSKKCRAGFVTVKARNVRHLRGAS